MLANLDLPLVSPVAHRQHQRSARCASDLTRAEPPNARRKRPSKQTRFSRPYFCLIRTQQCGAIVFHAEDEWPAAMLKAQREARAAIYAQRYQCAK